MPTITQEPKRRAPLVRRHHLWEFPPERHNVGGAERGARLLVGAGAAMGAVVTGNVWIKAVLVLAAIAGVLTSAAGYCPVNKKLGRDSFH